MSRNEDGGRRVGSDGGNSKALVTGLISEGEGAERDDWSKVTAILKRTVSEDAFQRWFREATLERTTENTASIIVPTETHVLWIEANYLPELTQAVGQTLGTFGRPRVVAGPTGFAGGDREGDANGQLPLLNPTDGLTHPALSDEELAHSRRMKAIGLNQLYTFDHFVVGGNNQFAHAACKAVASGAKTAYNPLFIHGDSGLGKTHLMQAIGQEVLRAQPEARVLYLTCERFTNEFIGAVQKGELEKFRRRYRRADVMLVDDVQFLVGKEKSQEEFFHTFNTLLDGQTQLVLTSDRPASEIQTLEPRLVTRFECGLTVALQPPQLETRIAILQRKMDEWEVRIPDEWVHFIASRIRSNVRRLEGALVRVATYSSLGHGELSTERIEELLRDILREEAAAKVSIDTIQKMVAEYFDIRLADMTSRRRPANIAFPRQIAMYLSRKLTGGSLVEIGDAFGGRDHGTVIHACKKVEQVMQTDERIRQTVASLGARLNR
jgi:chromosomal replication initiator protein